MIDPNIPQSNFLRFAEWNRMPESMDITGFRLYAFVCHGSDNSVMRSLVNSISEIGKTTREDFAIITFLGRDNGWAVSPDSWDSRRQDLALMGSFERSGFKDSLPQYLGLPDGPYILLTDTPFSDKFIAIGLSGKNPKNILQGINDLMPGQDEPFALDEQFCGSLSGLGSASICLTPDGKSLIRNITDIVAIFSVMEGSYKRGRDSNDEALKWAKKTLEGLKGLYRDQQDSGRLDGTSADRFLLYYSLLSAIRTEANPRKVIGTSGGGGMGTLGMIVQKKESRESDRYTLNLFYFRDFEKLSKAQVYTFNRLLGNYFESFDETEYDCSDPEYDFLQEYSIDYSPLGSCLGKIIEEELNASVVQLIRTLFGIQMPDYYREYDEGKDYCAVQTQLRKVVFNKKVSGKVYSVNTVPIGETGCAIHELSKDESHRQTLGIYGSDDFLCMLKEFSWHRNYASHSNVMGKDEFIRMYEAFTDFRQKFLQAMIATKNELKGRSTNEGFSGMIW